MLGRGGKAPAGEDLLGGEYSPVVLRPSWGLVSILAGLLALSARYWAWYLPVELPWYQRPLLSPLVTLIFGLIGLAIAWPLRRSGSLARAGLLLNGTICLIMVLLVAGVVAWRMMR